MELKLNFLADKELLYAAYSGDFSLAELKQTFLKIIEAIGRHEVQKVIVDGMAVTGAPTTVERFLYSSYIADEVSKLHNRVKFPVPRFAYVMTPPVLDSQKFGETVAINRGMDVRVFDNYNEALQWIGVVDLDIEAIVRGGGDSNNVSGNFS